METYFGKAKISTSDGHIASWLCRSPSSLADSHVAEPLTINGPLSVSARVPSKSAQLRLTSLRVMALALLVDIGVADVARAAASAPGSEVTASTGGSLTDATGAVWSIQAGVGIVRNGGVVGSGIELETDSNGVIWTLTQYNGWYSWTGGGWTPQPSAPTITTSTTTSSATSSSSSGASAPGSLVTASSGGTLTDASGAVWAIQPDVGIVRNGGFVGSGIALEIDFKRRNLGADPI